ncbi:MAG: cupin domain-containing protein [Anaerolineae bacterium]|nr:cupin domain-containing protein [Anaerolineae bacterium]
MSHTPQEIVTNPSTGEQITFLERAGDTGGAYLRFEDRIAPDASSPPQHIHAGQSETFTVKEGTVRLIVGGQGHLLGPNEAYRVPAGVAHTFERVDSQPLVLDIVITPALDSEVFFRSMAHAASQGGSLFLQIALLNQTLKSRFYLSALPTAAQNVLYALVAIPARWLGYRVHHTQP